MAKKQSNIGMFERAGYALGTSKTSSGGFDYFKGIAVAMQDVDRISASFRRTQDLIKNNPNGREIPKVSETTFPKVSEWLLSLKDPLAEAHKKAKSSDEETKQEGIDYINWVNKNVAKLNSDLEGAALKQQEAYNIESGAASYEDSNGNVKILGYAKANNSYQLANHQAFANGSLDERAVLQEDENGDIRLFMPNMVDGQEILTPWDEIDTGTTYNDELETKIDGTLESAKMLFNATDKNGEPKKNGVKLSKQAYENTYRPRIEKELKELIELKGGKEAIKNYMYNDDRLIEAFISNQVGIPMVLKDGITANPEWEAFKGGKTSRNMPASYDEFVNNNKFFADFENGFIETILGRLDEQFKAANEEVAQDVVPNVKTKTTPKGDFPDPLPPYRPSYISPAENIIKNASQFNN